MKTGIVELKNARDVKRFGGKASNLAEMITAGLPVPTGIAVGLDAFENDGSLKQAAKGAVTDKLKRNKLYAVRSSALAEDAAGASWAGLFETYLETPANEVIARVEQCHNSAKARAKAYAERESKTDGFNIAVVVQEMLEPKYAGVLFTKEPVTGADKLVTEYVEGLGEELVSGRKDPKKIEWQSGENPKAPFDIKKLTSLAQKVEQVFGSPQDIEWAWAANKMWLVQARPITTLKQKSSDKQTEHVTKHLQGYYLGEPQELFYWGPSRAKAMYMSDFMVAVEQFFESIERDKNMPSPPKSLILFYEGKMVWLSNARDFSRFTEKMFLAYEKRDKLEEDIAKWRRACERLDEVRGDAEDLVKVWIFTLFAEFSLYGAESAIARKLARFDSKQRQEIWGAFTVPDNSTFLARVDEELLASGDAAKMAQKYPWINDGYSGVTQNAEQYFSDRLKVLKDNSDKSAEIKENRTELAKKLVLSRSEVHALRITREIAEFMDDRKAWMMRTRRYITRSAGDVEHGWFFNGEKAVGISKKPAAELWERYVDFKASSQAVAGIVASNGGRHFINGEVKIAHSPTDVVPEDSILVVTMTSPSYVPLMRTARALITDHGGMMSHAAIVAREFNLPCIVGTKQATKVLKDGDKVVLDLVKGVVSK